MAKKKITRREFIKQSSVIGLGGFVAPKLVPLIPSTPKALATSKVVVVRHTGATNGNLSGPVIYQDVVQLMTNAAIRELTGIADLGQAWQSLFPGITGTSGIAIKINLIYPSVMPTHPQVVNTITNGLGMMFGGTYNVNNIIIYDMYGNTNFTSAGYTINTGSTGVRCFGTPTVGYDTSFTIPVGSTTSQLSKIITQMSSYLINAAVMKDHSQAGVTLTMKNHYGSVHNPASLFHGSQPNGCNPDIADINKCDTIKTRQKLVMIDALYGIESGGPTGGGRDFCYNGLIFSTDPVAADTVGRNIINQYRAAAGHTQLDPTYIHTAAGPGYLLGNDNLANINIVYINNPVPTEVSHWEAYTE
ncbi:MAG: DUF362 domain-containing protein [bacterium]|nr:DUF362 domain-containing protein [bacterium]